jgi:retron-type reverse transcriptase
MKYFLDNNLFSQHQYGFVKNRSVNVQLLKVVDDWSAILDQGSQVGIIYTDFEKAFDKVPHRRLLSKLFSYGVSRKLILWIESFLSGRTQSIKINQENSSSRHVMSGIPQGSVLGPVLFVIYINDLPNVCAGRSDIFMFADDAKMYKAIKDQRV